jgi:hypothetical protein
MGMAFYSQYHKLSANLPLSQGSLDDIVTHQPRTPPFSTDGLLDYLVELVVCEDKVKIPDSCLIRNC